MWHGTLGRTMELQPCRTGRMTLMMTLLPASILWLERYYSFRLINIMLIFPTYGRSLSLNCSDYRYMLIVGFNVLGDRQR
jgi:hypothetical protein